MNDVITQREHMAYQRGVKLAESWIADNGNLDAEGPDVENEAFYNGFIDRLADERRKQSFQEI